MIFLSHNLCFHPFILFKVTTDKGIGCIYKCDQQNWPYPSPNTPFFITQHYYTYIQTQINSAYDDSVGAHYVASSGLYQSTNHHGNRDVNDNDDLS